MPLATIVLPSYNYARYLPESLPRILDQLGDFGELVIIDDASTDGSLDIARALTRGDGRVRILANERNQGVHAALRRGLELAQGRYLLYAAADDRLMPGLLRAAVDLLERSPRAAFCTAPARYIDADGAPARDWPGPALRPGGGYSPGEALALMRRHGFWFCGASTVFRAEPLRAEGGFPVELGNLADSFVTQTLALRHGFSSLAAPMAEVRILADSYSCSERAELERPHQIRVEAMRRMEAASGLYPSDFIRQWAALWSFLDGLKAWRHSILRPQLLFLGRDRRFFRMRPAWPDFLFAPLLSALAGFQFVLFAAWGGVLLCGNPLFWRYLRPGRLFPWLWKQFSLKQEQRSGP
ncbi:glycosyltransferase family 2 protein [Desulfovibrio sp.]